MDNELEITAKKLSPQEQFLIRKNIVRLLKKNKTNSEIAELLDVSERHVRAVKKAYSEQGMKGIALKKRGRKKGKNLILTPEQEKEIQKIIVDKTPEQLKLKECMWTRKSISLLIKEKYGIDIKLSTLGYYLQRWGFTVQRPAKRAIKQNKESVDKWLNEEFPGINKRAKKEKAEIFFGDETNIQNAPNYVRGYAPKGKTPIVKVQSQRFKVNMLSAISKLGKLRFMLYKDNMTANKIIDFMRRLIQSSDKKIFLILDNLKVHHSKKVSAWIEKHKDKIEIFYLPPYAPEYNPDELVNNDLKNAVARKKSPENINELEHNVRSHLKILQNMPTKVESFFHAEYTKYAA